MRALIVGASPAPGAVEVVYEIAPEFDLIVAADGGARTVVAAGLDPDLVVGDADSLSPEDLEALRSRGVTVELHARAKDETDLDLAIAAARARGITHITVVGVTGGRLDHTLAALGTLMRAGDLSPEAVDGGLRGWLLDPCGRASVTFDEGGITVSIISLTNRSVVSGEGLAWPLEQLVLGRLSSLGISNRTTRPGASIRVGEGVVLVVCPEDDSIVHTS